MDIYLSLTIQPRKFPMTERLLQFIWQFQYFNNGELVTSGDEQLQIIHAGQLNINQGPDFSNAKIKLASTIWAGNIELHLKASDWTKHNHHRDGNYNNVILHVVWENDVGNNVQIPILELKERVSKILLDRYESLMNAPEFIACEKSIHVVRDIIWKSWRERMMIERLMRKAKTAESLLVQSNFHWQEAFWWLLARNFGMKVNGDLFEEVARSIPVNLLARHKNQIHQLEALLLGQANLLKGNFREDYPIMLQKEYLFYKKKYDLRPVLAVPFFLRMRPGNFPSIR
ncbi:MAG TPA: DUF2851 family protein, partial [Chitinophagaceae bacterium]